MMESHIAEPLGRPLEDESVPTGETCLAEHLKLICASRAFESSTTLKNLLGYLFEHRNETVNEYSIAVEALNRKPDFDPQIDATVRVQVSRLRKRLKDYYLSEGAQTDVRFTIPLGSHQLILQGAVNAVSPVTDLAITHFQESIPAEFVDVRPISRLASVKLTLVLGSLVLVLASVCGWQYLQLRTADRASSASSAQLPLFWRDFYANGRPVQIVMPNPIFFHWTGANNSNLMVRDTFVNSFANINDSQELATLQKKYGRPTLAQSYAVSYDIVASLQLMHYLDIRHVDTTSSISSDTSSDQFEEKNVILIGTQGTLMPFQKQIDSLYFKFLPHSQDRTIPNPQPRAAEPKEITAIFESSSRTVYPGIVALIPGNTKDSHILILEGLHTAALVSYLTSNAGCEQLKETQNRAGGSPYFEAIILSETEGNTILNSHIAAFRAYAPKATQN